MRCNAGSADSSMLCRAEAGAGASSEECWCGEGGAGISGRSEVLARVGGERGEEGRETGGEGGSSGMTAKGG